MQIQPGRVTVNEGVVFGTGNGRDLRCDVYVPPNLGAPAPALLLVHGGSWRNGDRSQLRGYGIQLGRRGFVCVACEYRLAGEATWPAPLHDVKAALRWMRASHAELGIDPARVAVSGNSAGGHLALLLAGTAGLAKFEGEGGHAGVATDVAAVVAFYPPTALGTRAAEGGLTEAEAGLMGVAPSAEVLRAASPLTYAGAAFPPTLLIHGNADVVVPHAASLAMYRALHEAGAPAALHLYDGAPHAFDAIPEFGRQCVEVMAFFLDRHVVAPRPVALPASAS